MLLAMLIMYVQMTENYPGLSKLKDLTEYQGIITK